MNQSQCCKTDQSEAENIHAHLIEQNSELNYYVAAILLRLRVLRSKVHVPAGRSNRSARECPSSESACTLPDGHKSASRCLFGITTSGDIRDDTSTERSASTSTEEPNTARSCQNAAIRTSPNIASSYQNSDIRDNISPMVRTKQPARKGRNDRHDGDDRRERDRCDRDDRRDRDPDKKSKKSNKPNKPDPPSPAKPYVCAHCGRENSQRTNHRRQLILIHLSHTGGTPASQAEIVQAKAWNLKSAAVRAKQGSGPAELQYKSKEFVLESESDSTSAPPPP